MTDKILILNKIPSNSVSHLLFDFDGTIATVREGWERVMGPYMLEVLGPDAETKVNEYIDKSAGVQTIYQMEWLVNAVRGQGQIPLDKFDYKKEYVRRLVEMADHRISRVEMGDIDREELMIAGAAQFLEYVHSKDMAMYIASGTDQEYVQRDANALDVAHFFGNSIYGAGAPGYSKKKIIEEVLFFEEGSCLAVFGDGPVEIREAKAAGAIGIGVAVNEANRQGWDETKVERLTEAGADILIPDFSDTSELIGILWG